MFSLTSIRHCLILKLWNESKKENEMTLLLILAAVAGPSLLLAMADGLIEKAMPAQALAALPPMFDDLYGV